MNAVTHTPVPSTQDAKDGLRRIGAEHDAMKMALDLIAAGVARIERNDVTTRFVYEDAKGFSSQYVELGWTAIINNICWPGDWTRCREALAARGGV